ncbi:MAG: 23S rRNA (adenine(2503)-C(2))-methyltransferase RlmN [Thermoanaerobaculia bacterium]
MQRHLLDLDPMGLGDGLAGVGEAAFRAGQVLEWVFRRGATEFSAMTDLPRGLRERLAGEFRVLAGEEVERREAPDGTVKILLRWSDGASTETVMIPASDHGRARRTVCLSTQVGCDVGCRFCASGIGGALRDLTVGEVLEQALRVERLLGERGERLTHVVFMGMGEPLANYEVTVAAVRRLAAPWGLGLSQRRIAVSTVGLPKPIERLAAEGLHANLALSLHAPNERLRSELIPWARGIDLERLLASCRRYFDRTGRELTLEYCLLAEVNDLPAHADQLAAIARDLRAHVNLLMYNPVPGLPYERPSRNRAIAFLRRLRARGARAHLRESRGLAADAACGQLRRRLDVA